MVVWAENVEGSPEDIFFALRRDGCWSETYRAHEKNEVPDIEPHVTAIADGGFSLTWQCLSNGRYVKRHVGGVTVPETSEEYSGEGLDEDFRPGVELGREEGARKVDLSDEYERQFFGDLMLFTAEELVKKADVNGPFPEDVVREVIRQKEQESQSHKGRGGG